jgi:hypothetical protein
MTERDFEQRQNKNQANIRSVYDFTMGILWSLIGLLLIFYKKLGFNFDFDPLVAGIFGGACIMYGLFRVWRGYKNKFRQG